MRSYVFVFAFVTSLCGASRAWADEAPAAPPPPSAAVVVAGQPASSPCWNCSPCRTNLELQGHVSLLTPELEGPVSLDTGAAGQVRWDPIDYGIGVGGRAALTFPLAGWSATIGGTFWGHWDDDATTSGTLAVGNAGVPVVSPVFTTVDLHAEATLWGVDFSMMRMCVCTPCRQLGWGVGVRAISFDEEASHTVVQVAAPNAVLDVDADNRLLALQVVGHSQWRLSSNWDLRLRGAAFAGWLHKESEVTTTNYFGAGTQVPQTDDEDTVGFGGELELSVGLCTCNGWNWRVGYGLLALFQVTRADEATDFTNVINGGNVIAANQGEDTVLVHRVFVGLSIDF